MLRFYFLHSHRVVPTSTHRVVAGSSTLPDSCELGQVGGTPLIFTLDTTFIHPGSDGGGISSSGFPMIGELSPAGVEHTRQVKGIYGQPAK